MLPLNKTVFLFSVMNFKHCNNNFAIASVRLKSLESIFSESDFTYKENTITQNLIVQYLLSTT